MKTEKFDDAIRRKVESVEFPHDDGDVAKVLNYISLQKAPGFWASYGKLLTYSISTLVITGLLIFNVVQHIENKTLQKNIAVLQSELLKKDSLARPSYLALSHSPVYQRKTVDVEALRTRQEIDQKLAGLTLTNKTASEESLTIQNLKAKKTLSKTSHYFPENDVFSDTPAGSEKQSKLTSFIGNLLTNRGSRKDNGDNNVELAMQEPSSLVPHVAVDQRNPLEKSYPSIGFVPVPLDTMEYENRFSWSDLSFKNISYRVGVGADLLNGFNTALWTEAFLSDRWSINVGLSTGSLNETDYLSEDDFIRDTGKPFREKAGITLPNKYVIKSIEASHSLVRMPLSLSYQQPLKRGYALVFGLGTMLDLSLKTNFTCRYQEPSGDIEERKEIIEDQPVTFNNMNFSVGLQKQWNHFVLQASPFINKQIKTVSYQNQDLIVGARVRLLYDFGRK